MKPLNWQYTPTREIKNFKDLEIEKQRLELHQKFLTELLERDKNVLKESLHPKNLMKETFLELFARSSSDGETKATSKSSPLSLLITFFKWIIKSFY